ncbi:hypothetical protein EVAR_54164_1 [Eumeta japonica]|uniref:Uncharacterized protein n=1 Tax=Eumeta variegata TaxID=151549 RepID=A0A4C1Y479_EUMVA|nr:hypothetical protein EVAR_54164_1 [Eumeta japonica]
MAPDSFMTIYDARRAPHPPPDASPTLSELDRKYRIDNCNFRPAIDEMIMSDEPAPLGRYIAEEVDTDGVCWKLARFSSISD